MTDDGKKNFTEIPNLITHLQKKCIFHFTQASWEPYYLSSMEFLHLKNFAQESKTHRNLCKIKASLIYDSDLQVCFEAKYKQYLPT